MAGQENGTMNRKYHMLIKGTNGSDTTILRA